MESRMTPAQAREVVESWMNGPPDNSPLLRALALLVADSRLLDRADEVQRLAAEASIESITSKHVQEDGYYTTWTVKRYYSEPVTRETLREALAAAVGCRI